MILLGTVSAMEATFTLKDVIYIGGLLVTIVAAWFAIKIKQRETDLQIQQLNSQLKLHEENFLSHKAATKARREEFKKDIEKRMDTFQGDNVREIMKFEDQLTKFLEKFDHYITEQQKFREEVLIKMSKIK